MAPNPNTDTDHATLLGLGARFLSDCGTARAYLGPGESHTYVVAVFDRLSLDDLREAMTLVYDQAGEAGPRRLLFWETSRSKGFDRDVLDFYKDERFKHAPQPDEVAVVTGSRVIRMVVAATGIGYRLFTGNNLRVYPDIEAAVAGQQVDE
jgi:hypothetical protein